MFCACDSMWSSVRVITAHGSVLIPHYTEILNLYGGHKERHQSRLSAAGTLPKSFGLSAVKTSEPAANQRPDRGRAASNPSPATRQVEAEIFEMLGSCLVLAIHLIKTRLVLAALSLLCNSIDVFQWTSKLVITLRYASLRTLKSCGSYHIFYFRFCCFLLLEDE